MKVTVLNGSPKGNYSVTIHIVKYLEKHFPEDDYRIINVAKQIKSYERSSQKIAECLQMMVQSDIILFSYPVYTMLIPYQLMRFIELIRENALAEQLKGKFASQISTSMHFYDHTAHRYIKDICSDLGIHYLEGFSADMNDILTEQGRKEMIDYWKMISYRASTPPINLNALPQEHQACYSADLPAQCVGSETGQFDTVIITDCTGEDISLRRMIDAFKKLYPYAAREVNIGDLRLSGGCLGCMSCVFDGTCIYKDNFADFLRDNIQKARAIVYASSIHNHYFSSKWRCFEDRQFCNGHRMELTGIPVGYIISGSLSRENNLREVLEARIELTKSYPCGIACDESGDDTDITAQLKNLAGMVAFALKENLERPRNFLGVGGMKVFRDLVYLMQGIMKEDHRFYKRNQIYDFPQKRHMAVLKMKLIGLLFALPVKYKITSKKVKDIMIKPYKKALEKY